jgi:hypothetical protein
MKHPFPLIFAGAILLVGVVEAAAQNQSAYPSADYSSPSDGQVAPQPTGKTPARTAENAAPTGSNSGTVIPNGPATADPAGAGASSSASLADHGETGTSSAGNR